MIKLLPILLLSLTLSTAAQSGRPGAGSASATPSGPIATVRQLFDEVNGYIKAKAADFDAKKIPFSDSLLDSTKREQRQLAAKYAATAGARTDLAGDDLYYLGMLHWIAENLDGTVASLQRFIASENAPVDRSQSARSIIAVVFAKQGRTDDAEKMLAVYISKDPKKLTERARMEGEIAKAYQAQKQFDKMAPHAEQDYVAAKGLLADPSSIQRGLDEALDAGMLVFEAYRDLGNQQKAEAVLDDMRAEAVRIQSPSFAYYVIDQRIKYLIDTGRKPVALEYYTLATASVAKDFPVKELQEDMSKRLKARQTHYKLLGEKAPEFLAADQVWFPGKPQTMADLRGKVVVLDFWATWCVPCFDAFPDFVEWSDQYKEQGLVFLGVTRYYGQVNGLVADEPHEIEYLKAFRVKWNLPYDFVVAKGQAIQILYGGLALPTTAIIDRKGVVRYVETGTSPTRIEQMREMIAKLIAEK